MNSNSAAPLSLRTALPELKQKSAFVRRYFAGAVTIFRRVDNVPFFAAVSHGNELIITAFRRFGD